MLLYCSTRGLCSTLGTYESALVENPLQRSEAEHGLVKPMLEWPLRAPVWIRMERLICQFSQFQIGQSVGMVTQRKHGKSNVLEFPDIG